LLFNGASSFIGQPICIPTQGFGLVHGLICALENGRYRLFLLAKKRTTDAAAALVVVSVQVHTLMDRIQDFVGDGAQSYCGFLVLGAQVIEHHDEFVTTPSCSGVFRPDRCMQPSSNFLQQLVSHFVAQRVIELLETVQVQEQ
jgi:hypothetical protein